MRQKPAPNFVLESPAASEKRPLLQPALLRNMQQESLHLGDANGKNGARASGSNCLSEKLRGRRASDRRRRRPRFRAREEREPISEAALQRPRQSLATRLLRHSGHRGWSDAKGAAELAHQWERVEIVRWLWDDFAFPTNLSGESAFSFDLRFRSRGLRLPKAKFHSFMVLSSTRDWSLR